jgi:hypothetical protein
MTWDNKVNILCKGEFVAQFKVPLRNYAWGVLIENQNMHKSDHFIVKSSQTLLHVSAY